MNALRSIFSILKQHILYGIVLRNYGIRRHRELLKNTDRSQSHTYTCFYRSPGQLEALRGPVMKFLLNGRGQGQFLINVFAGSTGAEAYTLASVLRSEFPELDFLILASDLHQENIDRANRALYSAQEVLGGACDETFVARTFDRVGEQYQVKAELRSRVRFQAASLLSPEELARHHKLGDMVFAQNVFFHLPPEAAKAALDNVMAFLKPKAALFIDGMDLDMRVSATKTAGLEPLNYKCRKIHEQARIHVGERWWNYYYGMEPYSPFVSNRSRRFSTVFFKKAHEGI